MPATTHREYPPPHVLRDARHVVTHPQDYLDRKGLIDMAWHVLRNAAGQRVIQSVKRPTLGPSK